jgi:hypothetical protein
MIKDIALVVLCLLVFVFVCFGSIVAIQCTVEYQQCRTFAELDPSHNYKWVFFGGCLAETSSGRWVDADDAQLILFDLEGE